MYGVTVDKVRKWVKEDLLHVHRYISGTGYIFIEDELRTFERNNKQYKKVDMDKEAKLEYLIAGINKCRGVIGESERRMQDETFNLDELLKTLKEEVA
jgi:hypothetical protein